MFACFDVFESDHDQDNLVDSLLRILHKSRVMGMQAHSVTASNFYG